MAEMNLVEKANKVMSFRKMVREACRKKSIAYPSDEKISEYINQRYGMNVDDFMSDYTEKEGIFRDPISDFVKQVLECYEYSSDKPTPQEIIDWSNANNCSTDPQKFITFHTLNSYKGIERTVLNSTLEMDDVMLVRLWNCFIEESGIYGADSQILDLNDEGDLAFLAANLTPSKYQQVIGYKTDKKAQFIQWYYLNDGNIGIKTDIKAIIIAYWSEIFDRLMIFPEGYCADKAMLPTITWQRLFSQSLGQRKVSQ